MAKSDPRGDMVKIEQKAIRDSNRQLAKQAEMQSAEKPKTSRAWYPYN